MVGIHISIGMFDNCFIKKRLRLTLAK